MKTNFEAKTGRVKFDYVARFSDWIDLEVHDVEKNQQQTNRKWVLIGLIEL